MSPQHLYVTIISKPKAPPPKLEFPSASENISEAKSIFTISFPIAVTALILYSRSAISMLFLGSLGDLSLAGGSLGIAFANITAYAVLSGLSLGMDPLCSQAFGANNPKLLSLTLHRSILFLLTSSLPISFLWLNMSDILLFLRQDPTITSLAQSYLHFSLPDLVSFSFIHPIRVYLRSQSLTRPLTLSAAFAAFVHVPVNLLLVSHLNLGVPGVAAASSLSNLSLLLFLILYIKLTGIHGPTWQTPTSQCLSGWGPLVRLAAPSCVSVCLEWWWYEFLILLCGLLPNPKSTVASMGILIQTTSLLYVFPSSLSFGVSTRVGNHLGADRPGGARVAASVSIAASALIDFVSMAFASGMSDTWGRLFTNDREILRLTAAAMPIVGLCELGNCPQTVGCGVLRGCARTRDAANVNLGAFYLVGMPVAVGLGFGLGLGFRGLWMGLLAAQVACAGLMLFSVGSTDWEAQARKAQLLTCGDEKVVVAEDETRCQPLISIKMEELEKIIT